MTRPAAAIPAEITVDRLCTPAHLVDFAHLAGQLDGTLPFVRAVRVDAPCAPADLLPEGAVVERCVTTDKAVAVLAWVDDTLVCIDAWTRWTAIQVAAANSDLADRVAEQLRARIPIAAPTSTWVRIWHQESCRPASCSDRAIDAPQWADIAGNYPTDTRQTLDALVALESPEGAGKLVLWHGPPGTGKTTALRALLRAWAPWCQAQVIVDPERFFAEPGYLTEVLTTAPTTAAGPTFTRAGRPEATWRLIVAEDADEYLRATARRDAGAALGRLLNLADGIMGQGMNVLVLLTTNEPISRLHPALVRPGRCLAAVEFPPFEPHQASGWLQRRVEEPMTLAELLAARGDITQVGAPASPTPRTGQYL